MKHSALTAGILTTLLPSVALAGNFQGNLVLNSQSDVDAASVYCGVTGNLTIWGADIIDLGPLDGFTQVGGYITMRNNSSLTQAIGVFPSLTDVGGGLFLYNNDSLLELSGFDALLQTGDNIDFWYNDVLERVSGFASLHTAGWSLEFGGNPFLVEIPEFVSLQTISSSLYILDNARLEAITGFQALQSVDWSFEIQDNPNLDELCGLRNYFTANNPYTGGGAFNISANGPLLPNPTTEQDVIDAGPCSIGMNYCGPAVINASGSSGTIAAAGSRVVTTNDVTLTASDMPVSVFGFFLASQTQNSVPMAGGSLGTLCLGGAIGRFVGPGEIQSTGGDGSFDLVLDLTAMPQPTGLVPVLSGETWNFQAWHRDAGPVGPTSNFTDGLSLSFL